MPSQNVSSDHADIHSNRTGARQVPTQKIQSRPLYFYVLPKFH